MPKRKEDFTVKRTQQPVATVKPRIILKRKIKNKSKLWEFRKNIYFYAKASDCVDLKKLWTILKETGVPEHLTHLLRNLFKDQKQQLEPDME